MKIRPAQKSEIQSLWEERWGLPIVSIAQIHHPQGVEGLAAWEEGRIVGLVTWHQQGPSAEIVTLDALEEGQGLGQRLLSGAESHLRSRGATRVWLVATNDNLRAAAFYQKSGYRLTQLHRGAMDGVRIQKPGIPRKGLHGIPLLDLWEFEKELS